MVSQTRVSDVLPDHVLDNLDDGLRNGFLHGFETASYDESVLLWGPPGSGKTTESLGRLTAYANEYDLHPRDVTCVTYRTALADSIRSRISEWGTFGHIDDDADEINNDAYEYWGTGHAVSCRASGFLDRFNDDDVDDLPAHAGMIDESAIAAYCDEHGIEHRTGVPWIDSQWDVFHALYTYSKQNLLDVGEWSHMPDSELLGTLRMDDTALSLLDDFHDKWGSTASIEVAVEKWETWKREHECHDFYEQLEAGFVSELPATEYVIIDELHDSYPLMTRVFEQWIEAGETVVVAGDPDQVCNSYTGAHPAIFENLNNRVNTVLPTVKLPKSHRVPDEHFAAAAAQLANHRTPPRLETAGKGELYRHTPAREMTIDDGEWDTLERQDAASPTRLLGEYGDDMMFLARTRMLVDAIGACLDRDGVMYRSQTGVAGNWELRRDVLTALKKTATVRPAHQTAIDDADAHGDETPESVVDTPDSSDKTLSYDEARALLNHTDERLLDSPRADALRRVSELEYEHERVTMRVLNALVTDDWWSVYGQGRDSIENLVYINQYADFTGDRERDVTAMKRAWDRYDGDFPSMTDLATKLWTLHAAKGDESEHVVVYTGVTGRVRDSVRESEEAAANESRTWYVALTRAKTGLHVVRDAFSVTCGNFNVIPDDMEQRAVEAAVKRRAARCDGGDSQ